ncbi:MAG: universal stress protein A, partial [Candidatus Azotimanducaceae bacterium]
RSNAMALYKKVLMALDFQSDNAEIIEKGQAVVADNGADLYLVHVDEPIAMAYAADGFSFNDQIVSLQASIRKEAQERMAQMGDELGVPAERRIVKEGSPAREIHEVVEELGIDLIVMGTHGQKGLQLLLGSTATSVLHGVTCDVLTVRVKA